MTDKELFLHLLLPVKKHLYNFVRKALNFSHDADDIFQEALLKGYRYFYSFDRHKNFKTWMFTIAHNLVKDYYNRSHLVLLEDSDIIPFDPMETQSEDVKEVYAAAKSLKPRQREIFFLYYYNEFKVPEIAEIMGLTKTNVKFILHKARESIKKQLEASQ